MNKIIKNSPRFFQSIRWKILATITVLVSILVVAFTYTHCSIQKRTLEQSLEKEIVLLKENLIERGKNTITNLTQHIENNIASYNFSEAVETVSSVTEKTSDIKYAVLMNASGKIFINTLNPSLAHKDLTDKRDLTALKAEEISIFEYKNGTEAIVEIVSPLQISTRPWGVLKLIYSLNNLEKKIEASKVLNRKAIQSSLYRASLVAPLIMIIYLIAIFIYAETISKPIIRLTQLAKRVSAGDFPVASDIKNCSKDEIGELETAFMEMSTGLKASYELLRESEEKYRLLAESVSDVLWTLDVDTFNVVYISRGIKKMLGYTPEEMVGVYTGKFLTHETLKASLAILDEELEREKSGKDDPERTLILELEQYCKDGSIIQVEAKVSFIRDKHGKPVQVLGVSRDVTARKRAEKEKKKLELQLHHAQKMETIGTMAGGIAHDFNNILGVITLNTERALNKESGNGETSSLLRQVLNSSTRGKELIEQILTFSRGKAVDRKPVQINLIINESLEMLRAMLPSDVTIHKEISDDAGAVIADSTQIQQVIMNLCANAAHAMNGHKGSVKVVLKNITVGENFPEKNLTPGSYVTLEVGDTGKGMTKEVQKRVFDPFFTTKQPGEGTGLGLSVVHGIVTNHKGAIFVESKPGLGTTFKIFFPLAKENTLHV